MRALALLPALLVLACGEGTGPVDDGSPAPRFPTTDATYQGTWAGSNQLVALEFALGAADCSSLPPYGCIASGAGTYRLATGRSGNMKASLHYQGMGDPNLLGVEFAADPADGTFTSRFRTFEVSPTRWIGAIDANPWVTDSPYQQTLFGIEFAQLTLIKR